MNRILRDIVIAASAALVARRFIAATKVSGDSMFPELHDGDKLLLNKTAYGSKGPEYGDVVVFNEPGKKDKYLIKRVIGLPGDHIVIRNGEISVNGEKTNDDFTADGATNGDIDMKVPEGRYFLLGDNRLHSRDSRDASIGCVPLDSIAGKVDIRLYPPGRVFRRDLFGDTEDIAENTDAVPEGQTESIEE